MAGGLRTCPNKCSVQQCSFYRLFEIHRRMVAVLEANCLSKKTVTDWWRIFRRGCEKTIDLPCPGQVHRVATDTLIADIDIVCTLKEISKGAKLSFRCGGTGRIARLVQATIEIFLRRWHSTSSQTMGCVS